MLHMKFDEPASNTDISGKTSHDKTFLEIIQYYSP